MSRQKKIIAAFISILATAAVIAGIATVWLWHRRNNMTAEVMSVELLNQGYSEDNMTGYGMVTNDFYQEVFLLDGQSVAEVCVQEGQEVKTGDKLLVYDMTLTNLQLEMQQLELQTIDNKITLAKRELEKLKKEPVEDESEGWTAEDLAAAIKGKERELRDLDLTKRQAMLALEQMKKVTEDGQVLATVDGVVKTVGDKNNPPSDGSAFITVSGSEGLYVTGYLSELQLGKVKVGQVIYANSWETGNSFEATIQEISLYPGDGNNSYGEGNPNVSYYPYTAYIENTEGLKNGMYVELTMTATYSDDAPVSIYLEKAYVREENGRSYVLKADENDRLVKQYVETGKTVWGSAVEIKSGVTLEDRIAFPYGKTAKEGIKVQEQSGGYIDDFIYY